MNLQEQLQEHLGDAFTIERELGGGGMSRVFVATERRLNRRVAIKVLTPELAQGLNAERFEREILLAASLQQANIVPVLAAGEVEGLPYFTMPFVEGESLRNRIGGGMGIDDVLTILRDVSRALAYAHQRGIVHRDIKPDNVLLSGGTAMVTDFGIAKAISAAMGGADRPELARDLPTSLTMVGTSIGTPPYMAPEQVAGDPDIDHRVDLYALGCMAYEMLTGKTPFADLPPQRLMAAHLSETPKPVESFRPDCPPALAGLVSRLLEKDPADRVGSAQEVVEAIGAVTTSSGVSESMSTGGKLVRSLVLWGVATLAVWILAKAAVVGIGLPEWTVRGAVAVMLLGLPVLLLTGWAKWMVRKAATAIPTPTLTPGGSSVPRPANGTMATIALKANRHLSFRRATRGGVVAMAVFVLLIAAFMVTRSLGIGPAASLFASGSLKAQDRVVLADIATDPADSSYAPIIQEAVRAALSQSRAVRLVPTTEVASVLAQMRRPSDTRLVPEVAHEVALRTDAKAILGGRLVAAGSGFLISLELRGTEQGAVLASFQGTADSPTDLLGTVDELTRKLRSKVGESLKEVAKTVPLARATTSSLAALRLYTEGARANDIEGDYNKAVRLLRQAVEMDSTFALAWRKMGVALQNGQAGKAAIDSALVQANKYSSKLPPIERNLVQGAYYDQHSALADRQKALDAYRDVFRLDSTNTTALNQIAMIATDRGDYDSATAYYRREYQAEPIVLTRLKIAALLTAAGKMDSAKSVYDSIAAMTPADTTSPFYKYYRAGYNYTIGDLAAAREDAATIGSMTDRIPLKIGGLSISTGLAAISGQPGKAAAFGTEADSLRIMQGDGAVFPGMSRVVADVAVGRNLPEAVAILDRIVASNAWKSAALADRNYEFIAYLYALAGATDKAETMLRRERTDWPQAASAPYQQPFIDQVEGEIALQQGKYAEAIAKFRSARLAPDGKPAMCDACAAVGLARAFDAAAEPDSARAWYERYLAIAPVRRITSSADPLFLASVHKRLGELYDDAGERSKAIEQYRAFVKQWQHAEPELQPAVTSVRARLQELAGEEGRTGGAP